MFLSTLHLQNWRSYGDARFDFRAPSPRRPLVLVGAMNGHGKTSLLLGLYLGLFGRFGLRHAEGFSAFKDEDVSFYRGAIQKFRRNVAPADEPTTVEIVFAPATGETCEEVRVVRRWFFTNDGKPRQGEGFETVELYVGGKPQRLTGGLDAAHDRLERLLFPAHFMPAFFFDGEQAQTLISQSGETGIKKAVEVMFGTKIVEEVQAQIKQFLTFAHGKAGGKRTVSVQQKALDQKLDERTARDGEIEELTKQLVTLEHRKQELEKAQRLLTESLARLGGERRGDVEGLHADAHRVEQAKLAAERELTDRARVLGLALAISRLAPAITNRLQSEAAREEWENLRQGVQVRGEEVLRVAMPEPPESDELLGHLSLPLRERVKARFGLALEQIYNPPPNGCAPDYLLGHAKGEMREKLVALVRDVGGQRADDIRACARRLKQAREELEDIHAKRGRIGDLPREVGDLSSRLSEVQTEIADTSRQLGAIERELHSKKVGLKDLSAEIGRLQEALAALEPEQKRIAVAERVHRSLEAISQELKPITLQRLQELVTRHFVAIADRRYRESEVMFPAESPPLLCRKDLPDQQIAMMSGFERRAFGIAFTLALAEITQRRIPLVIDTPLGNADNEYRPRLLNAVTNVELDQVIILTHDAEVAGSLFEAIEDQVSQTFLVEFDRDRAESVVSDGAYFAGVGR